MRRSGAGLILLVVLLTACSGEQGAEDASSAGPCSDEPARNIGDALFTIETAEDAVTFADSVVLAKVTTNEPASPLTGYPTDGTKDTLVGREVRFEVEVEHSLWRRPHPPRPHAGGTAVLTPEVCNGSVRRWWESPFR